MDGDSTQADLDQVGSTEDKQPGPIRRVFSALSNVFWGLVIVAAILFAWPAPWGGPVTIAKVQGHSMEPTLYTGDVAIAVRHYSGNYDVGAIVVYRVQQGEIEGMVVHRIIKRLENGNYITQGDNKESPDPWEIPPDWIFGEVLVMIPGVAGWLTLLKSPVFMAIMAGALVIWVFWPRKDELEDDEADGDGGETSSDGDEASSDDRYTCALLLLLLAIYSPRLVDLVLPNPRENTRINYFLHCSC